MGETKKKRKRGSRRLHMWSRILIALSVMGLTILGVAIALSYAKYSHVHVVEKFQEEGLGDGNYISYADGFLEYGRDGVAMLNEEREELWNQPCQISNPIAEVCEKAAVVGDKGGTNIYVFQKNGLKGEIRTSRPIEKIAVSSQGIVAAILQDEETPMIMCYDAKGNVLVQQKTSLKNTGYPMDLALSQDGKGLLVSYLHTSGNGVFTNICYYYFEGDGENKENHIVAEAEYKNAIAPTVAFLNEKSSLIVTDSSLVFYKGIKEPQEQKVIKFNTEISGVAYNDKYVAITLNKEDGDGYDLRLYRANGKLAMSTEYEGEYANLQVADDQVFLYEDARCQIFNNIGVCKYRGTMELNIKNVFPAAGFNKYKVINADGFYEIQLAR